jgi:hypothetical protein
MLRPRLLLPLGLAAALILVAFAAVSPRVGIDLTASHTALLMGSRTIEPLPDSDRAGSSEAFLFTAGRSGRATTIMLYVASGTRAKAVRAAIYTSRSGRPHTLLTSGIKRRPTADKWNAVDVRPVTLRANRVYWIAILGSGGRLAFRDGISRACSSQQSKRSILRRLPRRWATGARWPTCRLSAFVLGRVRGPVHRGAPPARNPTPTSPSPTPPGAGSPPPPGAGSPPTSFPGTGRNCVSNPSACGYPDATNSGVPPGTALTSSGGFTASTPGKTYTNLDIHGTVTVTANNVTIANSRITTGDASMSSAAITIRSGVSGTKVLHTTMQGSDCQGGSLFAGVMNDSNDQLLMQADYGQCLDDILHGSGTITDSYSIDNANIPGDHYEPIAYDGGGGSITIIHDTLLNPHDQTAAVFVTCYFGPVTSETITNSLLAGGDYVVYGPEGNGACDGQTGHQDVENNRFSRVYFPKGGQFGTHLYFQDRSTTWSGNVWDDTLQTIPY